ncbi:hypothetical protein AB4305_28880 [Nocardia sp. 2YAB30]|uniref:hypothetical protein n=1 Tax=Nocardia sp. 2YAB30 TaxID=3233022 RepID=UPI003F9AF70E
MTESTTTAEQIEYIFTAWDDALGAKDPDAAMSLYRADARWKVRWSAIFWAPRRVWFAAEATCGDSWTRCSPINPLNDAGTASAPWLSGAMGRGQCLRLPLRNRNDVGRVARVLPGITPSPDSCERC